ncbi:MAG: hypothetical protein OXD36_01950, partial [Rhodobacter sp.]|nr:hypothetical protein [Rhodobacter sp.]
GGSGTPTTTGNGENGGGGERETNADDCGTGTVLRDGKCVADTSTADAAEATKAAQALYNLLGTSNAGTAPADLASGVLHPNQASASSTQFGAADDDDKYSQSVRLEGAKFSEATGINLGTLAETGALKDYYPIAGGHSNAEADGFGTISQEKHELADNVVYFEISGTYAGVSGTFRCAPGGGDCTSKDGEPEDGTWHFKPNNKDDRVTGNKIEWGWWLIPGGDDAVEAVGLYYPIPGTLPTSLSELGEGKATYEGDATGQYAVTGDSGKFTAKATLTAEFGAAPKLSGNIHTFKGADDKARTGWNVELKENTGNAGGTFAAANGTTVWQGNDVTSGWAAQMYDGGEDEVPTLITGAFRAESQGGRMAGVFGAEHE